MLNNINLPSSFLPISKGPWLPTSPRDRLFAFRLCVVVRANVCKYIRSCVVPLVSWDGWKTDQIRGMCKSLWQSSWSMRKRGLTQPLNSMYRAPTDTGKWQLNGANLEEIRSILLPMNSADPWRQFECYIMLHQPFQAILASSCFILLHVFVASQPFVLGLRPLAEHFAGRGRFG